MTEGGGDIDPLLEHTEDKEDNDEGTLDFQQVSSSTPHNPGETFEMRTRLHEQSGLPDTSYAETDFGGIPSTEELEKRLNTLKDRNTGLLNMSKIALQNILLKEEDKQKEIQRVKDFIKVRYAKANIGKLKIRFSEKNLNQIVVEGLRGGETKKLLLDDGSGFQEKFLNLTLVKKTPGNSAETIISKNSASIKKNTERA